VAAIAELPFVVAAEARLCQALFVDLAVERDIFTIASADYILAPTYEHLHVCGAHGASRGYALLFVCRKGEIGNFA
jgi:hypothetical protein